MSLFQSLKGLLKSHSKKCDKDSLPKLEDAVCTAIPSKYLDSSEMKRIHLHWTAGDYSPGSNDKSHYNLLIDGDCRVHAAVPIRHQVPPLAKGRYAAHTRRANSYSIGIGICAMKGASDRPLNAGDYPLTEKQWETAVQVIAELCLHYGISVSPKTVLTHAEVHENLGVWQRGKWDIAWLPFWKTEIDASAVGNKLRSEVAECLKHL